MGIINFNVDYLVLRAVFKHSPHKIITFKAGHLGDREEWEEVLTDYLE